MPGLFDTLAGWKQHPHLAHVSYRVKPQGDKLVLEEKCAVCGDTFYWVCLSPERASWRLNTWASWHVHGGS